MRGTRRRRRHRLPCNTGSRSGARCSLGERWGRLDPRAVRLRGSANTDAASVGAVVLCQPHAPELGCSDRSGPRRPQFDKGELATSPNEISRWSELNDALRSASSTVVQLPTVPVTRMFSFPKWRGTKTIAFNRIVQPEGIIKWVPLCWSWLSGNQLCLGRTTFSGATTNSQKKFRIQC